MVFIASSVVLNVLQAQIRAGVSFEQQSSRRDGHQVEAPAFHASQSTNSASYRDPLADERTRMYF